MAPRTSSNVFYFILGLCLTEGSLGRKYGTGHGNACNPVSRNKVGRWQSRTSVEIIECGIQIAIICRLDIDFDKRSGLAPTKSVNYHDYKQCRIGKGWSSALYFQSFRDDSSAWTDFRVKCMLL